MVSGRIIKQPSTIDELEALLNEPNPPQVWIRPDGTVTKSDPDMPKVATSFMQKSPTIEELINQIVAEKDGNKELMIYRHDQDDEYRWDANVGNPNADCVSLGESYAEFSASAATLEGALEQLYAVVIVNKAIGPLPDGYSVEWDQRTDNLIVAKKDADLGFCVTRLAIRNFSPERLAEESKAYLGLLQQAVKDNKARPPIFSLSENDAYLAAFDDNGVTIAGTITKLR